MFYFSSIGCSPLIAMNPAEFLLDLANGNINDVSLPSELEDKVQMENSDANTRNGKPSPAVVHEVKILNHTNKHYFGIPKPTYRLNAAYMFEQYLVEAYETRVADREKKNLMVPLPLDEEIKSKVANQSREWGASWWEQYCILSLRGIKERRHDYFSWLRITQVLSTAVILGLLWWQSDGGSPKGRQDQVKTSARRREAKAVTFQ